jgi:hypothetical protein
MKIESYINPIAIFRRKKGRNIVTNTGKEFPYLSNDSIISTLDNVHNSLYLSKIANLLQLIHSLKIHEAKLP